MKRFIEWKVYGPNGKDQKLSYCDSFRYDFSKPNETRVISVECYDKTRSHKYVKVEIIRDTYEECYAEFNGQLSDGIFENYRYGKIEEIASGFSTVCTTV